MMNSDNLEVQKIGESKWIEKIKEYLFYFETIKSKLPKGFLKEFDKNDWFHDFIIKDIKIINIEKYSSVIEFQISHGQIIYKLTFKGVSRIIFNIPTTKNWLCGMLNWGYTEFEINNDNLWIIRILCDFDCEIEILFKRISINKAK